MVCLLSTASADMLNGVTSFEPQEGICGRCGADILGHQKHMIKYRRDIDGLRAVAVVPVLLFHLGFSFLSGGFVGVDIFFVISGYLIGRTINQEMKSGTFSILNFYNRRFRRILPALFFMSAMVWIAIIAWFLPDSAAQNGQGMLTATLSVSNILFWRTISYFANGENQAFLHTWSLGVEEQFYLFFPLFMVLVYAISRIARRDLLLPLTLVTAAISFGLCVAMTQTRGSFAFYMLPTRTWELLLGFLVSLVPLQYLQVRWRREAVAATGLLLIILSLLLFDQHTPFPGVAALAPCLGAALLIAAGAHGITTTGWLLESRPMVFIGLISYSLYLWHWPLIIIGREGFEITTSSAQSKLLILAASFLAATVSWRFVEQPFRRPTVSRKAIFVGAGAGALVISAAAIALIVTGGMPARFDRTTLQFADFRFDRSQAYRSDICHIETKGKFSNYRRDICLPQPGSPPALIIIGDSHAAHLWWGLQQAAGNQPIYQATAVGCIPLLPEAAEAFSPECQKLRLFLRNDYLPQRRGDTILLSGRWSEHLLPSLQATLQWARSIGLNIVVAGDSPIYSVSLPHLLARAHQHNDPDYPSHFLTDRANLAAAVRAIAAKQNSPYLPLQETICPNGACVTLLPDGTPMFFDEDHLTPAGSAWLMRRMWPRIADAVAHPQISP